MTLIAIKYLNCLTALISARSSKCRPSMCLKKRAILAHKSNLQIYSRPTMELLLHCFANRNNLLNHKPDGQGRSHHFRSEGDKLFRGQLSDLSSSRIQLHLSLVAT